MKSKDKSIAIGKAMHLIAELADTAKKGNDAATIRAMNAAIDHIGQSIDPPKIPHTKAQLWRRVARLAGEHLFEGRNYTTWRSIDRGTNIVWMLREFIKETKSSTAYLKRKWQRRIAKMEAALKAWEECSE